LNSFKVGEEMSEVIFLSNPFCSFFFLLIINFIQI
jgi:hypothetical protein